MKNALSNFLCSSFLTLLLLITFSPSSFSQGSCTPGEIISGSSTVLNPDNNLFFSKTGSAWTETTEENSVFEEPDGFGTGGANLGWTAISGTEPTGLTVAGDVQASSGCNNTDINTDSNGGSDFAYYSIVDPDNIADNGDEYFAFAIRISDKVSGAFSYTFLIDSDNNCGGVDPNATCGNPCFEYEVQLETNKGEVDVTAIDGCSGTADCDLAFSDGVGNDNGDAIVCEDCNGLEEALQVCAGSSECGGNNPVFWIFTVDFSKLAGLNSTSSFSIVPATTTSPNSVIYKNTNVSDYGGIGDPNDVNGCDCTALCLGSSCSDCIKDCALACAGEENEITFPVELISFFANWVEGDVELEWITSSELNNSHFEVEHSSDGAIFSKIGAVNGFGTTLEQQSYRFMDDRANKGSNLYRLKQVDLDGVFSYSHVIKVSSINEQLGIEVLGNPVGEVLHLNFSHTAKESINLEIQSLTGVVISKKTIDFSENASMSLQVPVTQLSKGIYFLRIRNQKGGLIGIEKFVKL